MDNHRKGRWTAETAEKFAYLKANEIFYKRKLHGLEHLPSSKMRSYWRLPLEMDDFTLDKFIGLTTREPTGGHLSEERFGVFERYAVLLDWIERKGGRPFDHFDLGLEEFKPGTEEEKSAWEEWKRTKGWLKKPEGCDGHQEEADRVSYIACVR
ncbi:uncharacterized protein BDV14DRAFT_197931 [Aspergillus stella-maris]|uniref:uncharacterized protein n=1 Tax=Aspergillus stella-maris TaxID=1810926 RepID=UPI003CCD9EDA